MKKPGFLFLLVGIFWQLLALRAAAQDDPFHCDSLKTICFNEAKIKVRYFEAPKTCAPGCPFCRGITQQNWLAVNTELKKETKLLTGAPQAMEILRARLLAHRLVNFVVPGPPATNGQPEALKIGFQVPYMTYTWAAAFKMKPAKKAKPTSWKLQKFADDSNIYSHLNTLGADFQQLLRSDSAHLPAPLLPDHNYLASWFGTRQLTPAAWAAQQNQIRDQPRVAIKTFLAQQDAIGLTFMLANQNLRIRYLALEAIKTLQDKTCLPYLLRLAEYTTQPLEVSPEISVLYSNYCEQLVAAIGVLTECSFNRCPYAHYPPQHYLKLGLPTWQNRIDHRESQGIGSYVVEL